MEIQEKNDPVPVSLMLWEEGERPQMCPVRHLLTYLSLINYKSGYLFPNDLSDLHGNYTDHVPYQTFLNEFNEVCKLVLNRPGPFGTHTMRKTAYLFAIWGKAEEVELMVSARHKTVKSSIKYRKDAVLMRFLVEVHRLQMFNTIPKWKPIKLESIQMAKQIVYKEHL